jgi:Flp pilus assembly protein TadG
MMMVVITGMFSFGIALNNQLELTQAVGAGAQYLQTIRSSTSNPCADTIGAIESAAPNLHAANISMTLTMSGTAVSGNTCAGDQSDLTQGGSVTVYASYPCNLFVYGLNLGTSCKLQAQVTEYEY